MEYDGNAPKAAPMPGYYGPAAAPLPGHHSGAPAAAPMPGYYGPAAAPLPGHQSGAPAAAPLPGYHRGAPAPAPAPAPPPTPTSEPQDPGGYFAFSEEDFQNVATQWQVILQDLKDAETAAAPMTRVVPMAQEPGSRMIAKCTNDSGNAYLIHNRLAQQFVSGYIDKLERAHREYLAMDQQVKDALNKIDKG